jgi:hypothetical protein
MDRVKGADAPAIRRVPDIVCRAAQGLEDVRACSVGCGTPRNRGRCRQVPPDNARLELSAEERSALEEHGEAMFGELHAEMRAQQDRRLQLVPGFLQIAAVTVTANVYLLTSNQASIAVRLVVSGFSAMLILGSWGTLHRSLQRYRDRQRLLQARLDVISRHWSLHRLLDPAPLQNAPGPTADQRLIAVVASAVLVLLALALAAHLHEWGAREPSAEVRLRGVPGQAVEGAG